MSGSDRVSYMSEIGNICYHNHGMSYDVDVKDNNSLDERVNCVGHHFYFKTRVERL